MSSQLKATRRARGLAIWGLSVMSGVSPSLLTAIEKWGYVPGANTQQRIADALGVQVEDIWTQEEAQPASEEDRAPEYGALQEPAVQTDTEGK
jgi:lambda repressor-like predicted transcriptional regulator